MRFYIYIYIYIIFSPVILSIIVIIFLPCVLLYTLQCLLHFINISYIFLHFQFLLDFLLRRFLLDVVNKTSPISGPYTRNRLVFFFPPFYTVNAYTDIYFYYIFYISVRTCINRKIVNFSERVVSSLISTIISSSRFLYALIKKY